jgi:hypothetical protein
MSASTFGYSSNIPVGLDRRNLMSLMKPAPRVVFGRNGERWETKTLIELWAALHNPTFTHNSRFHLNQATSCKKSSKTI